MVTVISLQVALPKPQCWMGFGSLRPSYKYEFPCTYTSRHVHVREFQSSHLQSTYLLRSCGGGRRLFLAHTSPSVSYHLCSLFPLSVCLLEERSFWVVAVIFFQRICKKKDVSPTTTHVGASLPRRCHLNDHIIYYKHNDAY